MSCLTLHLSCASLHRHSEWEDLSNVVFHSLLCWFSHQFLSQSFLWPIPHFYHLFVTLQLSEEKNKSWSGSFNRLQSHAAAPFVLRGFEPGRRRITICTLYTDKVVHMGENQKAVSWLVYCLSLDFKISTGVGSSSPCDPDCRRKRPHGGWTSTGIGLTIVQQSQPKNNKQVN